MADSIVFVALTYKAIEAFLLAGEGVLDQRTGLIRGILCLAALLLTAWLQFRFVPLASRERWVDQVLGTLAPAAFVASLAFYPPGKGFSGLWLPLEWHKLPLNIELMSRISPAPAVAMAAFFGFLTVALASGRRPLRVILWTALAAWAIFNISLARSDALRSKAILYGVAFGAPPFVALFLGLGRYLRWASRSALAGLLGTLIFWHYAAVLPPKSSPNYPPPFELVYPRPGTTPDFPLAFMRDYALSPDGRFLYTNYGPASGLARIDLQTGTAEVRHVPGLSRYLWLDPSGDPLYTMDWDRGDFIVFGTNPFLIRSRADLLEQGRVAPWSFDVTETRLYIGFHEAPILAEFDRASLSLLRTLDLKREGWTRFNSGLYKVVFDRATHAIYTEAGMTDLRDRFVLLKIDPDTFAVTESAELPEGGLDFTLVPPRNTLVTASFFSNRFYEYSLGPLQLRRVIEGPLNSRNIVYDARRNLLYALAFLPGELRCIAYDTGQTLVRQEVGNKAQSLLLDAARDALLIGSSHGVYRVTPGEWVGRRP
ncbi:MAG: hypothetical protein HYY13_09735 [Nitrospirae bacterium]|nr:hypothetical protein [Nitrospirota bacterium]